MNDKKIAVQLNLEHAQKTKTIASQRTKSFFTSRYFGYAIFALIIILFQVGRNLKIIKSNTMNAIVLILIWYVAVLGFNLLMGYSGLASLGTAGFIGLGAYITAQLFGMLKLPFIVSLLAVIIVAIVLGVIVGFVSLRVEGIYLAIVTLGLAEILSRLFWEATSLTNGEQGLNYMTGDLSKLFGFINHTNLTSFFLILIIVVFLMVITTNIMRSPTGRAFLSMKNSTSAAQAMGISLLRYRLLAFVLATIYASISGLLFATYQRYVQPTTWNIMLSLNVLAAVVIGGAKSVWASFAGTALIFGLQPLILDKLGIPETWNIPNIINGVLIILVVMFFNRGLLQIYELIKTKSKKRHAKNKINKRKEMYGDDAEYEYDQKEFIEQQYQKIK